MQKLTPFGKIVLLLVGGFILAFLCVGAGSSSEKKTTPTPTPELLHADSVVFTTWTPAPTNSPAPTETPTFTPMPTPTIEPIFLVSYGDSVFDIKKWKGPAILKIKYTGDRNFIVQNYPAGSTTPYDLLVNTIGSYEGTLPLDFRDGEHTTRFEITASGTWELEILPLAEARIEKIPGTIIGMGDDVVVIGGGIPDLLKADASQASRNFIVEAIANERFDLVINEIAPYTGTKILDPGTVALIIKATGLWTLEVTAR